MTIAEMHQRFKVGMDKVNSLALPSFEPEEIDLILNIVQERMIKNRLFPKDQKPAFEETEKRAKELGMLVKSANITTFTTDSFSKPQGVYAAIPSDCRYVVQEEVQVSGATGVECDVRRINNIEVWEHDDYNALIQDPFHKPDKYNVARLTYQDKHELLFVDGIDPTTYYLRYIKSPVKMNLSTSTNCELRESIHQEIIDEAVSWSLENIESPRYQTNLNELNKTE